MRIHKYVLHKANHETLLAQTYILALVQELLDIPHVQQRLVPTGYYNNGITFKRYKTRAKLNSKVIFVDIYYKEHL